MRLDFEGLEDAVVFMGGSCFLKPTALFYLGRSVPRGKFSPKEQVELAQCGRHQLEEGPGGARVSQGSSGGRLQRPALLAGAGVWLHLHPSVLPARLQTQICASRDLRCASRPL